jgi:hypothetical protein
MAKAERQEITEELYNQVVFEDGGDLVINLTDVEEAKFELIPKGIYEANIDNWEFGLSESSGAKMFTGTFQLEHPDYSNVKLKSYFSFGAKALPFTKRALNQFAPDVFSGAFKPQEIADSGVMIGRKVRVRITHGEYQGQKRSQIGDVLPAAAAGAGAANGGGKSGSQFF